MICERSRRPLRGIAATDDRPQVQPFRQLDVSGQTRIVTHRIEFVRLHDDGGTRLAEIGMRDNDDIAAFYRHSLQS